MVNMRGIIEIYCLIQTFCMSLWDKLNGSFSDFIVGIFPEDSFVHSIFEVLLSFFPFFSEVSCIALFFGTTLSIIIVLNVIKFLGDVLPT